MEKNYTAEVQKYLNKRRQIADLIMKMEVNYQSLRDEIAINTTPNWWEARDCAEKILSKFGINKPQFITDNEGEGHSIG